LSELAAGSVVGKDFRILRPLREGGMGAVYVVEQISTGKERALKVMAPALAADPATRERFVLEARAGSRIESDHVVEVVTAGIDEATGAPFLVMELLRGEELADAAARIGPMPLGDVAEVLSQMGHALEQAHARGIVHRDLKLENVFLASSRRRDVAFTAKILDFGIAKLVEDSLQKTGTQPLGTPLFMAPEQTDRRGAIRPATDVWALGLIAFKLLTGRDFWRADGSLAMLLREICVDPLPFASVRATELAALPIEAGQFSVPPLPPGFDAWFAQCVNRNIDARFSNAGDAVRAFCELVTTDAPRGALVARTGSIDAETGARASTQQAKQATSAAVARPVDATGAPVPRSGKGLPIAAVAGVLIALGGWFAYRSLGPGSVSTATATPTQSATPTTTATATPTPTPTPTATTSDAGSCDAGMLPIPAGTLFMGSRDLGATALPPHKVTLARFCLDKTEVTTSAYLACAARGGCEKAPKKVSWPGLTAEDAKIYSPLCNALYPDHGDHPINCVDWSMADVFCRDRHARLPTEAEWEYAARGSGQRSYPWGDDPPGPKLLNACGTECASWFADHGDKHHATMYAADDGYPATAPVGSFPAGASEFGVLDLAGNVWEWTADWDGPYSADPAVDPKGPAKGSARVVRGGDFTGSKADWASPAYRWKTNPDTYNHAIGFRCAASPQ
jgi:formylglycine-generating enzyme required for sulfatase activity/tRNA A-37 threonylcarbamoyl transferase component Bud32